jgi:hypothetical protein
VAGVAWQVSPFLRTGELHFLLGALFSSLNSYNLVEGLKNAGFDIDQVGM